MRALANVCCPPIAAVGPPYRVETCCVAKVRATVDIDDVEGATVQFRVQFLDVSAAVIKEMHIDAHSVPGAIELVAGLDWPSARFESSNWRSTLARCKRMLRHAELDGDRNRGSRPRRARPGGDRRCTSDSMMLVCAWSPWSGFTREAGWQQRPNGVNCMYEIFCSISRASAKRVAVVWTVRARLVLDTIDARPRRY